MTTPPRRCGVEANVFDGSPELAASHLRHAARGGGGE